MIDFNRAPNGSYIDFGNSYITYDSIVTSLATKTDLWEVKAMNYTLGKKLLASDSTPEDLSAVIDTTSLFITL